MLRPTHKMSLNLTIAFLSVIYTLFFLIMKRRHSNKRRTRKGRSNKPRFTDSGITTASFSGSVVCNLDNGSGVINFGIYPTAVGLCQRWEDLSANFQYYRIVKFEYFLIPATTRVSNEMFAHAVLPSDPNSLPMGNFGQLCMLPATKIYDARQVTLQRNSLGRKALLQQPSKWWTCKDLNDTEDDYVQAKFYLISSVGAVSNTVTWFFKFVCEYRSAAFENIAIPKQLEDKIIHDPRCKCSACSQRSSS